MPMARIRCFSLCCYSAPYTKRNICVECMWCCECNASNRIMWKKNVFAAYASAITKWNWYAISRQAGSSSNNNSIYYCFATTTSYQTYECRTYVFITHIKNVVVLLLLFWMCKRLIHVCCYFLHIGIIESTPQNCLYCFNTQTTTHGMDRAKLY